MLKEIVYKNLCQGDYHINGSNCYQLSEVFANHINHMTMDKSLKIPVSSFRKIGINAHCKRLG